jgi:quercetin dioxygenase-like cupin family protein
MIGPMPHYPPGSWLGDLDRAPGSGARAAGRFRFAVGDLFDRHVHDGDELWFVTEGRGRVRVGAHEHLVAAGDILLAPAGEVHDILAVDRVLAGFFAELIGPGGETAPGGHQHVDPADAVGHPIAALQHEGLDGEEGA